MTNKYLKYAIYCDKKTFIVQKISLLFTIGFVTIFWVSCDDFFTNKKIKITKIKPLHDTLPLKNLKKLQDGDIVLRAGFGMASAKIIEILHEPKPLSHCGIFFRTPAGDSVISSESSSLQARDGVQTQSLRLFLTDAQPRSFMAVRLRKANKTTCAALLRQAKYYEKRAVPFDYAFNHNEPSAYYCAELLRQVFIDVLHQNILTDTLVATDGGRAVLRMQQFYQLADFEVIIDNDK